MALKKIEVPQQQGMTAEEAYANFLTKEQYANLQKGDLGTHSVKAVYGVIDSTVVATQDVLVNGSGFGIFADNKCRVILQEKTTGYVPSVFDAVAGIGQYEYSITYVDQNNLTIHFQIKDVIPQGDYILTLGDVNGSIYVNAQNLSSVALIKVGGYTTLDFDSWQTYPIPTPSNFVVQTNNIFVGTTNVASPVVTYKPTIKSNTFIPHDKNFDLEIKADTVKGFSADGLPPYIFGVIGITNNQNISIVPSDISNGILYEKPVSYSATDVQKCYYSENGGATQLIGNFVNTYSYQAVMRIKSDFDNMYISIYHNGISYSKVVPRISGSIYIKAISLDWFYSNRTNFFNIGATINCKIW